MKLGVNVDHAATLRQARREGYPDPVYCAKLAQQAGADSIVMHLREDRRHIQEDDLIRLKNTVTIPVNLEMSINPSIVKFALGYKPFQATLVPERRRELTTEGGLDLKKNFNRISRVVKALRKENIKVSLFIDPCAQQISLAHALGVDNVELHTGAYCNANKKAQPRELKKIAQSARLAKGLGLFVAAGHGLNYNNTSLVAAIPQIEELNIGHAIIAEALYEGMLAAVKRMIKIL